jgi:mono/diheme cytochrome c family protein
MGKQLNVRDLRSTEIQKQTNVQLAGIIKNGKGKMPAFGKSLNDGQINQLVAFIRTLRK